MNKTNKTNTKDSGLEHRREQIAEGKKYVFPELCDEWSEFVKTDLLNKNFERQIDLAILIMKNLSSGHDISKVVGQVLRNDYEFPKFCEISESIVLNFSPRGIELVEFLCPSWQSVPQLCDKIQEIQNRNLEFEKLRTTVSQPGNNN